jgi:ferritin
MTKTFIETLNKIHKELWDKSDDGEIQGSEIEKTIKVEAGHTVVNKYWNELEEFNRIEQVPSTQKWVVEKPEDAGLNSQNFEGDKKPKQVMIPKDVLEAGEQFGVNFSALLTEAVVQEVSNMEQFVTDFLGEQTTDKEAEYIFSLVKKDLHAKKGDKQRKSKRGRRRRELFKEVFETEETDYSKIEELRKQAFELADILEL